MEWLVIGGLLWFVGVVFGIAICRAGADADRAKEAMINDGMRMP